MWREKLIDHTVVVLTQREASRLCTLISQACDHLETECEGEGASRVSGDLLKFRKRIIDLPKPKPRRRTSLVAHARRILKERVRLIDEARHIIESPAYRRGT